MDAGQSALSSLWILQYTYGDSGVPLFPKSSAPERKSMFDLQSARTLPNPLHGCKNVASGSTVTHSSQKPTLSCIFPAIFCFTMLPEDVQPKHLSTFGIQLWAIGSCLYKLRGISIIRIDLPRVRSRFLDGNKEFSHYFFKKQTFMFPPCFLTARGQR